MTTGELLDKALSFYLNQGSPLVVQDRDQREKAHFFLTQVRSRVWQSAPYFFRKADGTVQLTAGVGTMPSDFSRMGTEGQIYVSGQLYRPLMYKPPDWMKFQIQNNIQQGEPWAYTLYGLSSLGVPMILCWPQDNSLLDVRVYDKKPLELIDHATTCTANVGAAGALSGDYRYGVTFTTALGETELDNRFLSPVVSPVSQMVDLTDIPTWWGDTVTGRRLYRTTAGGLQPLFLATIADNLQTTYTDNALDGTLGSAAPTRLEAITGIEQTPIDFHDSTIYEGLQFLLARSQGDNRDIRFSAEWDRKVQRMWEEIQQGQNEIHAFPAYPGTTSGHPVWSRWTPPR